MKLSQYDHRYVSITDIFGETFSGFARYEDREFLMCEYGGDEDGIFIEDVLIYRSLIASIEEIEPHGTAEIWTENLILRRCRPEDAEPLYEQLGTDPDLFRYSGWNPYATPEMARETVRRFIEGYDGEHFYSWIMDRDDVVVGTIGAYDYRDDAIEVGFSVVRGWRGRGFATEALEKVLDYLTENEGIACVTAWCASENAGSKRVLEKAGMKLVGTESRGLTVGDRVYDRLMYAYRRRSDAYGYQALLPLREEENCMWKCPKCGRAFQNENQSHYCGAAPETIDEYILAQDEGIRDQLQRVRTVIGNELPDATEKISWSMPTWWQGHNIIHFAAQKKHIGLYPGPEAVAEFAEKLGRAGCKYSKGAIQIPYSDDLPLALIAEIAAWCRDSGKHA